MMLSRDSPKPVSSSRFRYDSLRKRISWSGELSTDESVVFVDIPIMFRDVEKTEDSEITNIRKTLNIYRLNIKQTSRNDMILRLISLKLKNYAEFYFNDYLLMILALGYCFNNSTKVKIRLLK